MIRVTTIVAALVSASWPAAAQMSDLERLQVATDLGTVLGSEAACDLSYDHSAIAAFVEERVPADDMAFPSTLNMMAGGTEFEVQGMSQSLKTAHCTQIRRIAKSYGFIE